MSDDSNSRGSVSEIDQSQINQKEQEEFNIENNDINNNINSNININNNNNNNMEDNSVIENNMESNISNNMDNNIDNNQSNISSIVSNNEYPDFKEGIPVLDNFQGNNNGTYNNNNNNNNMWSGCVIRVIEDSKKSNTSAIIYELSEIEGDYNENDEQKEITKKILCYRRYSEFYSFYSCLKVKYPEYAFPRIAEKTILIKLSDNPSIRKLRNERTNKLMYFINTIQKHEVIGKSEELKKFLYDAVFDDFYFKNVPYKYKDLDKLENSKKKSYFGGLIGRFFSKANSFTDEENRIINEKKDYDQKDDVLNRLLSRLKWINETLEDMSENFSTTSNNIVYLKDDKSNNYEGNYSFMVNLAKLNLNESKLYSNMCKDFFNTIILPLEFCILDVQGVQRAIGRFNDYINKYYKSKEGIDENGNMAELMKKTEVDKKTYINILNNEIKEIEKKNIRIYNRILNDLKEFYKNKNIITLQIFKYASLDNK